MRQLNLPYFAPRKGLNTFACETTFRCSYASQYDWRRGYSAGQGGRLAFRPPCLEHMKRFGLAGDSFIYPRRGSWHSPRLPLISKNTGFCSASRTTGVRIQQGSECLAEFAFRDAFRQLLPECLGDHSTSTVLAMPP